MLVERVTLNDIMSLRVRVLRDNTPVSSADYVEYSFNDVVHLGIRHNGVVVATSTWFSQECPQHPHTPAIQLKGMAVDTSLQTTGYGRALIEAGLAVAKERDALILWARARDTAIGFYERCGFHVVGDGFIDEPTAMPHHIVIRNL